VRVQVLDLEPESYQPHRVHSSERIWPESNCAADLWIEVLNALSLEPIAAMGFTLSSGFDGEQWTMFKFLTEDLRRLYGIDAREVNLWRELPVHMEEHIALGRMLTLDVDAWWLPDTAGLTYRTGHQKTTITVQMIDEAAQRLGYFHNGGYYELGEEDFDYVTGRDASSGPLPPYAEAIDLERLHASPDLRPLANEIAREHLARRPVGNPVRQMRKRMEHDLPWLVEAGLETFHRYAFGSVRQCGSNAELASDYVSWLSAGSDPESETAAAAFEQVAKSAKALEFVLARALRGKKVALSDAMSEMESSWDHAIESLAVHLDA
jgi:hypothetical protein